MKPIIFNTEDVRATLDNRKTVTRRVVKPQPVHNGNFWELGGAAWSNNISKFRPMPCHSLYNMMIYKPDDILYVRETFCRLDCVDCMTNSEPFVHCTNLPDDSSGCFVYKASDYVEDVKWHSPVSMPKEAVRIFLRVTDVRVEKLQSITMGDMLKEGIIPHHVTGGQWQQWQSDCMKPIWNSHIKPADRALYGWEANPWVWVIEFERISKEEAQQHE